MTRSHLIRRGYAIIAIWSAGAMVLGLASHAYPWLMVGVFAITVVAGVALMRIRCEVCGHPVFRREGSFAGARFAYWSPIVTSRCRGCGTGAPSGLDKSTPSRLKQMRVVLIFLIVVNLIGGIGLAQRVDERFVWAAIVIPAICFVVFVLSFTGLIGRRP